mmetsp:Transcript_15552/g.20969  ORF Transcript_15552/g.20969 Transcript_15552/m.20969 type:complete len:160 (+) Transcript_15552:58-537(+)
MSLTRPACALIHDYPFRLTVRNTFLECQIALPRADARRRVMSCPAALLPTAYPVHLVDECDKEEQPVGHFSTKMETPHLEGSALLSLGSMQHDTGLCKPCAFVFTETGCANAETCLFCHVCSPGEKSRRRKVKRNAFRAIQEERRTQRRQKGLHRATCA